MTRAIVIKRYGDPALSRAIAEGMTCTAYQADQQIDVMKAELARYKDKHALRVYGDEKRLRIARRELARKYSIKHHGRAYNAILGFYGLLILCASNTTQKIVKWVTS